YPFLAPVIGEFTGEKVALVDPAMETVEELAEILAHQKILNDTQVKGSREFYVSGNEESFYRVGRMLLGDVIEKVEKIDLD
ncbi:MAG: glutamate racemase, partial [Syntrophomonas sp.]